MKITKVEFFGGRKNVSYPLSWGNIAKKLSQPFYFHGVLYLPSSIDRGGDIFLCKLIVIEE